MLKSWSIENFKAIVNSGDLKLAPVTILAGKNSSGKSSLLQSILMIAQTLSNQNSDLALLTNGDLAKLRTFEDILSDHSDTHTLTIHFEFSDEYQDMKPKEDVYNLYDSSKHKVTVTFVSAMDIDNRSSAIESSKVTVENILMEASFQYRQPNIVENSIIPGVVDGYRTASFEFDFIVEKIANDQFKAFLTNIAPEYLRLISSSNSYLGRIKGYHGADRFFLSMFHFLPTRIMRKSLLADKSEGLELASGDQNIIFLELSVEQITQFFTNQIRYLGPFRAKPDITAQGFSTKGSIDDVGIEGEYAASVYHANQNAAIDWYNPGSKQVEQGALKVALDTWVQYLGVAHQVTTEVAGLAGVTWKVVLMPDQKAHTLSEVGVGLSQILPVLVMGILSPKNSLLIMEQPELHLHSQVQARLGDFFVGIAKCHKQCIIETHSENIVSQLRYHIVEAGGQEKSDCIIYFVEQDDKGAAKFEPVDISPNGNILNWPDGFFDETMHQENRINAASIRRRARLKKNG